MTEQNEAETNTIVSTTLSPVEIVEHLNEIMVLKNHCSYWNALLVQNCMTSSEEEKISDKTQLFSSIPTNNDV